MERVPLVIHCKTYFVPSAPEIYCLIMNTFNKIKLDKHSLTDCCVLYS